MATKWEDRFWSLAAYVAKWSKDPKAKVGAVVTTERGGAVALGYNGLPAGVEDSPSRLRVTSRKLDMVIHAEQNALLIAGRAAQGAKIYVWGKPICAQCAGAIIQAGIKSVIGLNPRRGSKKSKWYKKGLRAIEMFDEAGVFYSFRGRTISDSVAPTQRRATRR